MSFSELWIFNDRHLSLDSLQSKVPILFLKNGVTQAARLLQKKPCLTTLQKEVWNLIKASNIILFYYIFISLFNLRAVIFTWPLKTPNRTYCTCKYFKCIIKSLSGNNFMQLCPELYNLYTIIRILSNKIQIMILLNLKLISNLCFKFLL